MRLKTILGTAKTLIKTKVNIEPTHVKFNFLHKRASVQQRKTLIIRKK